MRLTDAERRVLVALYRPLRGSDRLEPPASNNQIGEVLSLSSAGVKNHIRALFAKLDIEALPQNRKRTELARRGDRDRARDRARRRRLSEGWHVQALSSLVAGASARDRMRRCPPPAPSRFSSCDLHEGCAAARGMAP